MILSRARKLFEDRRGHVRQCHVLCCGGWQRAMVRFSTLPRSTLQSERMLICDSLCETETVTAEVLCLH